MDKDKIRMTDLAISVVMPVYNGELYLKDAIDSILKQTFTDFEFIIVNDGSTDSTESIILNYSDNRIKYIKQKNTGIGGALRNGCNMSKGKYIARMDADDISFPNRLELQYAFLEANPTYALVGTAMVYIDNLGRTISRSFPYTTDLAIKNKMKKGSVICHPSVMMHKSKYVLAGGYQELQLLEDLDLWMKISNWGKLYNFSFPLIKYRILNNSISRSISSKNYNVLIQFLQRKVKNHIITNSEIIEFNNLYNQFKFEVKSEKPNNLGNLFMANSKIEFFIYKTLVKFGINEKLIQYIICKLKNGFSFF